MSGYQQVERVLLLGCSKPRWNDILSGGACRKTGTTASFWAVTCTACHLKLAGAGGLSPLSSVCSSSSPPASGEVQRQLVLNVSVQRSKQVTTIAVILQQKLSSGQHSGAPTLQVSTPPAWLASKLGFVNGNMKHHVSAVLRYRQKDSCSPLHQLPATFGRQCDQNMFLLGVDLTSVYRLAASIFLSSCAVYEAVIVQGCSS